MIFGGRINKMPEFQVRVFDVYSSAIFVLFVDPEGVPSATNVVAVSLFFFLFLL